MVTLNQLKPGDIVQLKHFGQTPAAYRRRLLSYGLTHGSHVKVIQFAPLGCPVLIQIRGLKLSLRLSEASLLQWEYA